MPTISVLMSVYNETCSEIGKSVESLLAQQFIDFECIIVLDKPDHHHARHLLETYANKDPRVRLLINRKNIGLALSLNRAAQFAKGDYFLRMDADDICMQGRFERQLEVIQETGVDLVCSSYDFIDENSDIIPCAKPVSIYSKSAIRKLLPLRNVIHHPTVLMKAAVFRQFDGYRNFPCAQDYDLWLRMLVNGCSFFMMSERTIQYRIRSNSTSSRKKYLQHCTHQYIRQLYFRSKKGIDDGYSYEAYQQNYGKMESKLQRLSGRFSEE